MDKRLVYTRFDGGVSIFEPADEAISWMSCGGMWQALFGKSIGFREVQIERMIARGIRADAAERYADAVTFGGCTTAEALEILRDRDCAPYGTAIELWDVSEIPTDRWFRNAWRRSPNGGPISIDLKLAKPIQFRKARAFVEKENNRRAYELELKPLIEVDWDRIRERIRIASDETELRTIWPCQIN